MYLAAISHLHHSNGFWSPVTGNPRLKLALRGLQRKQAAGSGSAMRHPLTMKMLKDLSKSLHSKKSLSTHDRLMMQAALSVAFFGFLRVSEFTTNRKAMRRGRFLTRKDVLLTTDELKLNIKYSKTDQLGNGSSISMGLTGDVCCPVLTMKSYLKCCHAKPGAPLFHFASGRPLSSQRLRSTLRSLLRRIGYDPRNFNTHSFRIGAATAAARAGLPTETIKQLGRWRSNAYSVYVRHTPNHSSTTAQIARAP